ncbi:MAG: MBOAT family O-acyltransferase [Henriciella sp.]
MVFSSAAFLFLFLPVFLAIYLLARRWANLAILLFSLLFYFIGEGWFVLILLISITLNYAFGLGIGLENKRRKLWLALGLCANLGLLFYFKYTLFFVSQVLGFPESALPEKIHLPIGISFFTFQGISYLVDVYRGQVKAERSISQVATYIAMFPQLIAGPIVRYGSIAASLVTRTITARHVYFGIVFFSVGLAEKVLIADTVAEICDAIYAAPPSELHVSAAWLGGVAYMLQIFFDFSGYSAMAIGLGLIMGFEFPRNFNFPYTAQSITEFWRRWHISLSTWFREYVYIPLGGNRVGAAKTLRNLVIVFLLTGIWHGAAWGFVIWGIWHGAFMLLERIGLGAILKRAWIGVRVTYTLLVVYIGWIFFRANSVEQAFEFIIRHITGPSEGITAWAYLSNEAIAALGVGAILSTPAIMMLSRRVIAAPEYGAWRERFPVWKYASGLAVSAVLFALPAIKILSGAYSPFIYFRF